MLPSAAASGIGVRRLVAQDWVMMAGDGDGRIMMRYRAGCQFESGYRNDDRH